LVFEFKTKGAANTIATQHLKAQVTQLVTASRLFSSVTTGPAPNGAVISVTIDNVPLTDDVYAKGFVTGLTLGLAGNTVTDGYVCIVRYVRPGAKAGESISKTVRHAIHTTVGATNGPPGMIKAANPQEAVETMTRQIVLNGLDALAGDPAFW